MRSECGVSPFASPSSAPPENGSSPAVTPTEATVPHRTSIPTTPSHSSLFSAATFRDNPLRNISYPRLYRPQYLKPSPWVVSVAKRRGMTISPVQAEFWVLHLRNEPTLLSHPQFRNRPQNPLTRLLKVLARCWAPQTQRTIQERPLRVLQR